VAVGVGVVGLILATSDQDGWYLEAPDALTVEGGDSSYWSGAVLERALIHLNGGTAEAQLHTPGGALDRQFTFRDGADGARHYTWQDQTGTTHAELSVNVQTREYFYIEQGSAAGKPYTVKAHGWLKAQWAAPSKLDK
jgi:hypothetical protein